MRAKQENQDENLFKKPFIPQGLRDILKKIQIILTLQLSKKPQSNEET